MTQKRKWTMEARRKLAEGEIEGGFAGPDMSFPIAGPSDVADAWALAGHADDPDQVRRNIIRIARKFGWLDALPETARRWAEERGIPLKEVLLRYPSGSPIKHLGDDRIGGYAVLWGNEEIKDLVGEFFTPQTEELDAVLKATGYLPIFYQHAADRVLKASVIGLAKAMQPDDLGLWYEAQIIAAEEYRRYLMPLIEAGLLATSSGTLPAAREVDHRTGRIKRWPIIELSLTPTPAEARMISVPVAPLKSALCEINLPVAREWPEACYLSQERTTADWQGYQKAIEAEYLALLRLSIRSR